MSFITLQSRRNDLSPQALDSSYFRNDFKNGVLIKPGDTLSLVNLTINTAAEFIINDMNDTMVFRLGNRQTFTQFTAKLRHGAYDGPTAAKIIDTAMNDAIVGGIWKRKLEAGVQYGFNTTYDNTTAPAKPTFSINMVQQIASTTKNLSNKINYKNIDVPTQSGNTFNTGFNTTEITTAGDVVYDVEGIFSNQHMGSIDLEQKSYSAIDIGEKGIFLNGGSAELVVNPVKGIDTTSAAAALSTFTNLYEGGTGGLTGDVWKAEADGLAADWLIDTAGNNISELNCNINATGAAGGWDLTLTFTNPVRKEVTSTATTNTFFLVSVSHLVKGRLNGVFIMGNDSTADPTNPASANAPVSFWYYDSNEGCLVGSNNPSHLQDRINIGNSGSVATHKIKCVDPANLISATLVPCAGYCSGLLGIARQQFFYGDKEVADQAINTSETGMDASIQLIKDDFTLVPRVKVCRIVAKAGKTFGASGWRDGTNSGAYTFPGSVGQFPLVTDPTILGSNFTPGDSLRIGIQYTGLTSFNFYIEVAAAATPTVFTNRKNLVSVGRATSPASLASQTNSPIKQSMWNIRTVSAYGGGGYYDPAKYTLSGINDSQVYSDKSIYSVSLPAEPESLFRFGHPEAIAQSADLVGSWKVNRARKFSFATGHQNLIDYSAGGGKEHYDDDTYVFEAGGRFDNVFGPDGTTENEAFQTSTPGEGTPIAPHDNSAYSTYTVVGTALTLLGKGAYIGNQGAANFITLSSPDQAPSGISYTISTLTSSALVISLITSPTEYWIFNLNKVSNDTITTPLINAPQSDLITPTTLIIPAGPETTLISELNRSSGTDAFDVSQKIELPSQYTGHDVNSISLYMNNNDPNGPSFDVLLDLYANITDPTATDIATRFAGQTPFYTTFTINIPPSGTSERTWDILTDTSAYPTFYIVVREFNHGSMTNLGIKGDFNSNLTEGSTAGMLGGLKHEVKGNLRGSTTLDASTVVAVNPITTLSTLFKFGIVGSGDLNSDADIEPNVSNCSDLIGMDHFLEGTNLANTFPIVSTKNPEGSVTDLNMMVCLEDFNINGKNGGTGDDTKIICVVPKEQLTQSNTNINIMHYTADFPIAIDLNPAIEQTYYSLTASLRDMEGKFIRSLESPTHITLLHERDKKNAMAEAISSAIERENERKANIQSHLITTAGLNNPRI